MSRKKTSGALSVGVLQAFRATLIGFIPIGLVTLVAWAAGGSGDGKSEDAIHGAGWIWLAAHHVGFELRLPPGDAPGRLWLLPLGLSVIPWFVLRDSGRRIAASVEADERLPALLTFAIAYALGLAVATRLLATRAVTPSIWAAIPNGLLFALACGAVGSYGFRNLVTAPLRRVSVLANSLVRGAVLTSVLLYGASLALIVIALIGHWSRVTALVTVLDPGWLGLVLLILLTLASLPNAVIMTASLVAGAGFAIGQHTLISPWEVRLHELPAFPLLGILPTGRSALLTLLPLIAFIATASGGFVAVRSTPRFKMKIIGSIFHAVSTEAILVGLNLLAGGELLGGKLSAVGASYWRILLFTGPIVLVGSVIGAVASLVGSTSEGAQDAH